jgi:predicted nucleic acid-binding protein
MIDAIETVLQTFTSSFLAYDEVAARRSARLQEARRETVRPLAVEDGVIAATCTAHGATLATRNADERPYDAGATSTRVMTCMMSSFHAAGSTGSSTMSSTILPSV